MRPAAAVCRALVIACLPASLAAQTAVCSGRIAPFFGWRATDCVNCTVYGSYLEYLTEPKIGDIPSDGPAAGRLREHDTLVSVDGIAITKPDAWHRLRDALPGDTVRFGVRRDDKVVETSIVASARCVAASAINAPPTPFPFLGRDSTRTRFRQFKLGETIVEVDGPADTMVYDPAKGEVVLRIAGTILRVRAKP